MTNFQTLRLSRGRHASPQEGACVMELASMLAGEEFSDRPTAVCPVIGAYLRTYNDLVDPERRQELYPYAARVVGTRGRRRTARKRARLCRRRALRLNRSVYLKLRLRLPLAHPETTAVCAAKAMLESGSRAGEELELLDEMLALGRRDVTLTLEREGELAGARPEEAPLTF